MNFDEVLLNVESDFESLEPGKVIDVSRVNMPGVCFLKEYYKGRALVLSEKNGDGRTYSVGIIKYFGGMKNA